MNKQLVLFVPSAACVANCKKKQTKLPFLRTDPIPSSMLKLTQPHKLSFKEKELR